MLSGGGATSLLNEAVQHQPLERWIALGRINRTQLTQPSAAGTCAAVHQTTLHKLRVRRTAPAAPVQLAAAAAASVATSQPT